MPMNKEADSPVYRLAVDTGGTFTDVCLAREEPGEILLTKVPSTPHNPALAVLNGISRIMAMANTPLAKVKVLLHGTTVATNALLEGKGSKSALITTRGFRDILLIGRQNRPALYDFWAVKPKPLIERRHIFEVRERILASGEIHVPLAADEAREVSERIRSLGIDSVAICFLHAYRNPEHERQMERIIKKIHPQAQVNLSSEILPEFREYERTSTTVINAVIRPLLHGYLTHLEQKLTRLTKEGQRPPTLFVMQSNGGVITAGQAKKEAVRTVLSGPAAGVMAGVHLSRQTGRKNLITFDMGGTSTDICLIKNGQPRFTTEGQIGGYCLRTPMLDIHTIGAGGGSIAWIDAGGALRVGPVSAGAVPGPACYGLGGRKPTVTDANLLLGRLSPENALVENKKLDFLAASRSIAENIARPLGLTQEEAAAGIITVANAVMARAIRVISVQRGHDPREFTLVAFGGAGPLHAAALARELNIPRVLIPPYPGVTSALGMFFTDVRRDYVQTFLKPIAGYQAQKIEQIYQNMEDAGKQELLQEGFPPGKIYFLRSADLRYHGQSYELTLPVPAGPLTPGDLVILERSFHLAHQQEYASSREKTAVEIVNLRLTALVRLPKYNITTSSCQVPGDGPIPVKKQREVFWAEKFVSTAVYRRKNIPPGQKIEGPAVIEQADTTTLIWPGMYAWSDKWGNLLIDTRG